MTEDDIWFDKFEAEFDAELALDIASWDFRDSLNAHEYLQEMLQEDWKVEFGRINSKEWEARIQSPSISTEVVARGRTRLSALSAVHQKAFRRLGIL